MSYDLNRIPEIAAALDGFDRECAITLALKITDDSCKMDDYERSVFMKVYDALPEQCSDFFDPSVFGIIEEGRKHPSAQLFAEIRPLRQAGMEYVTRPKMKAFKAMVRAKLQ